MNRRTSRLYLIAGVVSALAITPAQADPVTSFSHFDLLDHTVITFEQDGQGNTFPVVSSIVLPSDEYAALGVTILGKLPLDGEFRIVRDNASCFRTVQSINGSLPYGLSASSTDSFLFDPPVSAFAVSFVATQFQFATFTALDANGNVIEVATMGAPFTQETGACGFLEYGIIGISSETPIHRVDIDAFSGSIDHLHFAPTEADDDNGDGDETAPEDVAREIETTIVELDLSAFNGPNNNANNGRRGSLANRAEEAAGLLEAGDPAGALAALNSLLEKIDDVAPPPDWMHPSPEKTALADEVRALIAQIEASL